jgi:hypothetical protein
LVLKGLLKVVIERERGVEKKNKIKYIYIYIYIEREREREREREMVHVIFVSQKIM